MTALTPRPKRHGIPLEQMTMSAEWLKTRSHETEEGFTFLTSNLFLPSLTSSFLSLEEDSVGGSTSMSVIVFTGDGQRIDLLYGRGKSESRWG
jgi:hypothetical protein